MRHLTVLLLLLLLLFIPSCKFFSGKGLFGKKGRSMDLIVARQDSIRIADSLRQVMERATVLEKARLDSIRQAEEQMAEARRFRYNIIVGSFLTPEYASGLADDFRGRGYDPNILKMDGSQFQLVSAEAHERFSTAVERLARFQDTVELDAWLYIIK